VKRPRTKSERGDHCAESERQTSAPRQLDHLRHRARAHAHNDGAGECNVSRLSALYSHQKGCGVLARRRVHEPAQRLYRLVLARSGGLHAARRVCLRDLHDPGGRARGRVLPLRRVERPLLVSGDVPAPVRRQRLRRRREPGARRAGRYHLCGAGRGALCVSDRSAGAAPQERLSGHRHARLCRDPARHLPVAGARQGHQRREHPQGLSDVCRLQHHERFRQGALPPERGHADLACRRVHLHHRPAHQLLLRPRVQGHPRR